MTPTAKDFLRLPGTPRGQFVFKAHHITLTLNHQLEGSDTAIFDDSAPISGFVELDRWRGVQKLEVELHGVVDIHEYGGLKSKHDILRESLVIWEASKPAESRAHFEFKLSRPENQRLPPTYQARVGAGDALEVNGFHAAVDYTITVRSQEQHTGLSAAVPGHLGDLLDHKLTVPFIFISRLRSPHKGLPASTVLAGTAATPDGISRSEHTLRNASEKLEPIHASVEIPDPNIFCLQHPVPVVLRIRGSELTFANIRASLHRLTIIKLETPMTDPEVIGQVDLQQVSVLARKSDSDDLVFAGDIPVYDSVTAGTFSTERLSVHDFLVIEILPPSHEREALLKDSRISIPINFTTD